MVAVDSAGKEYPPPAMGDVHNLNAGAEKISPGDVSKQAGKLGNASQAASDLGDHLRSLRDEVQRTMSGKDADAIAAHIDQLAKASYQKSDETKQAQAALQNVTTIMESVKAQVKHIAEQAKEKDKSNRQLIEDTKAKKKDDLDSASSEIEKLRKDNEHMSGQAKKAIEDALNRAEQQIDDALKPLGIEMQGGGFVAITPARSPGNTAPQSAGPAIDAGSATPMSGSAPGGGADTGGAAVASSGSSGSSSSGGTGASAATPSGPPPKPIKVDGKNPAKIAEQLKGQWAADLMANQSVPMTKGVPTTVCCANFVSGCLQKAGLINFHSTAVADLQAKLQAQGWQVISPSEAKPGDVAIVNHGHHVELCAGNGNLIGSNNTNGGSGPQQISDDHSSLASATMVLRAPGK